MSTSPINGLWTQLSLNSTSLASIYHKSSWQDSSARWVVAGIALAYPCYLIYQLQQSAAKKRGDRTSDVTRAMGEDVKGTHAVQKSKVQGTASSDPVARVSKLLVHPIKSCRGTSVAETYYTPQGFEYDRMWCIVDATTHDVITGRSIPKMVLISPTIQKDPTVPHNGSLRIDLPGEFMQDSFSVPLDPEEETLQSWTSLGDVSLWGNTTIDGYICQFLDRPLSTSTRAQAGLPIDTPSSILSRFIGRDVLLVRKGPKLRFCKPTLDFPSLGADLHYQDGYPLLILSSENLEAIHEVMQDHVGKQGIDERWEHERLVVERFRPNVILEGAGAFAEDEWERIAIRGPSEESSERDAKEFDLVSKCTRCLFPNVDPTTGVADKAVPYKVLMKFRAGKIPGPQFKFKTCLGCNAVPRGSGMIRVGDVVSVKKAW